MAMQSHLYQSEYAQMLRNEGRLEGKAKAVLVLLEHRGVAVPAAARERILACTDIEVLEGWICRTVTAARIEDLFD